MKTIKGRENWLMSALLILLGLLFLALIWRCSLPMEIEEPVARTSTSYGWFRAEEWTITLTASDGADGAATDTADSDGAIRGHLYGIYLDFQSTVTTTTDITVSLALPTTTVLALTNTATDAWYYPVVQQVNSAGTGTSTYDRVPISGHLTARLAQSTPLTTTPSVTVTVWWGD